MDKISVRQETPGSPRLLVYQDAEGTLQLDMETVQRCFVDSQIEDYLLCLLSVIGEKRCGKSFLMNYILKAFSNQERGAAIGPDILGGQNECLTGFQWQNGADSVTKGIWIWDRPFKLERNGQKMAVFILDTEGSLDTDRDQEIGNKLSALSMFLSSYLIFNVNKALKTTEFDLLEIYAHIQQCAHNFVNSNSEESSSAGLNRGLMTQLEILDLLIRDWNDPRDCGREAGRSYLDHEIEKLQNNNQRKKIVQVLKNRSVRSFLLPHPGNTFLLSDEGNLTVMDTIFRDHFTTYICDLLSTMWRHPKTDTRGNPIRCGDLIQNLEKFVNFLRTKQFNFGNPRQMYFSLENFKNQKVIIEKLDIFLGNVDPPVNNILAITPPAMRSMVEDEIFSLLSEYRDLLLTDSEEEKTPLVEGLKSELNKKQETFCSKYSEKYKWRCDEENRRNKDMIIKTLENFLEEKRSLLCEEFKIRPLALRSDIEAKIFSLLSEYEYLLLTDSEEEKRRLIDELKSELEEKQESSCSRYKVQCDKNNRRKGQEMTENLQKFLIDKNPPLYKVLGMRPSKIKSKVEQKIRSLQSEYRDLLLTDSEKEKTPFVDDLKSQLKEKQEAFCSEYKKKYEAVLGGAVALGAAGVVVVGGAAITVGVTAIVGGAIVGEGVLSLPAAIPIITGVIGAAVKVFNLCRGGETDD